MINSIEAMSSQVIEQKVISDKWEIPDNKELHRNFELPAPREDMGKLIIEKPDIAYIERTSRVALFEQNHVAVEITSNYTDKIYESSLSEQKELSDEERADIKKETGWSGEIVDCIENMEQYEILKNAGLKEAEIIGRKCLVKENFTPDYTDDDGISNRDMIERKLSPLDNDGNKIYLHHLGQKSDSPLIELTFAEHRQGGNDTVWHDKNIETEVHGEGSTWNSERKEYWNTRIEKMAGGNER